MPRDKGKGKSKVTDTSNNESAPLLGSPSRTYDTQPASENAIQLTRTSKIASVVYMILIVLATLLVGLVLFLVLLAGSFKPSSSELSSLPKTAFKYSSPDQVQILNITDDGLLLNISLRCGIDADKAFGVKAFYTPDEKVEAERNGERGIGSEWWENLRKYMTHKALSYLEEPSVSVDIPNEISISSPQFIDPTKSILSINVLDDLRVPLVWDIPLEPPSSQPSWLQPISFTALARPLASTGELWEFVQRGWVEGAVKAIIDIERVKAKPTEKAWWTKYAEIEKEDLSMEITTPIPRIPNLPNPGRPVNLSELVTLQHYSFNTSQSPQALTIEALATVPNFAPALNVTLDFSLPFSIALPALQGKFVGESKMAEVITQPLTIGGVQKDIQLRISGVITADLSEHSTSLIASSSSSPLSLFLQNYLHGKDNPITVTGLSALPPFVPSTTPHPPNWLLRTLPSLSLPLTFPGPKPKPKIIESVTIDHMRISESGKKMKASGTVIAQIELPHDMQSVQIDVVEVLPDVLVFDGPSPEDDDGDQPPSDGYGDSADFPPRAFGHIRPEDYLNSTTSISGDPNFPNRLIVSAPLKDVDLDILPGRDGVLSDFIGKVIFKGGALAGVKGLANVGVKIVGVNGKVRLENLPVRGEFWVGKQRSVGFAP
ncbi:uncharacterized protein I303_100492 [Kwoniella dejecticola CBS 10117]|uniref:Uncharacterized protein n=1 Tax=Kwoniella dejecticola CBS 10117 TaxID=1296121 RepID=A0A1A6AF27_9TREE|nr:uncharacterized protein I303_00492 [Kwoniella dejecticola CBS 10117]OBR88675.1 hypothetical protein I303_00492 [Kwoniella dejecticola CBS 10117]